jgi:hypothetical protein
VREEQSIPRGGGEVESRKRFVGAGCVATTAVVRLDRLDGLGAGRCWAVLDVEGVRGSGTDEERPACGASPTLPARKHTRDSRGVPKAAFTTTLASP